MRNHVQLADAYYRLSDEERKYGESASITNQRTIVREYCEKHGIILVEEFADDGYSGGNFERHVALYIGNGQIIHARYSVGKVMIDSLSASYYASRYVGAKRIA